MNKKLNTSLAVGASLAVIAWLFWGNLFMHLFDQQKEVKVQNMDITTGVKTEDLVVGTGRVASAGDSVTVHYVGTLVDGKVFDSSRDRGQPFSFALGGGQVIRGWDEGLVGMKIGGTRRLIIAPDYAYGDRAVGPIPPNSILIFEVELLGVDGSNQ